MNEKQELKTRIEEEESLLRFFVVYEEEFKESESKAEREIAVNDCLDNLILLYQKFNK